MNKNNENSLRGMTETGCSYGGFNPVTVETHVETQGRETQGRASLHTGQLKYI